MQIKDVASVESRTDHKGVVYESQNSMCYAWGIRPDTYSRRISRGWSKEKALTTRPRGKVIDPDGREWDTPKDMCEYWGVQYNTYLIRITKGGYSIEEALTLDSEEFRQRGILRKAVSEEDRTDHEGRVHNSRNAMCKYWGISLGTYRHRLSKGFSKKEALTMVASDNPHKYSYKFKE